MAFLTAMMERRENNSIGEPYLPANENEAFVTSFKRRFAYSIWKRNIRRYRRDPSFLALRVLEFGCGPGFFLENIEKWFPCGEMYGIDISQCLLDYARKRSKRSKLLRYDGEKLPFENDFFDIVCSFQVIEHLDSPSVFFKEAYRTLKDDGLLLLSTPNPRGIASRILGKEWPGIRRDHVSLKDPRDWRVLLRSNNFDILDEGTTLLSGFRCFQRFPLALVNWIPLAIFGYFPWYGGESYMVVARKG